MTIQIYKKKEIMQAFPEWKEKGQVISLVGGGGKTTLMYTMAQWYHQQGYRVLVSTTTHIQKPNPETWVKEPQELEEFWKKGVIPVAGEDSGLTKIRMPQNLESYIGHADIILLEADGAKRHPCKVPIEKEPVLLPQSNLVIGVMGLDALGKPIGESCFRVEETCKLLRKTETERLTPEDMATILMSEKGTRKNIGHRDYYIVLNKCDSEKEYTQGVQVLKALEKRGMKQAVLSCLQ